MKDQKKNDSKKKTREELLNEAIDRELMSAGLEEPDLANGKHPNHDTLIKEIIDAHNKENKNKG